MVHVFVSEYVSGGGLAGSPLPPGLAAEGCLMLRALVEDLAALPEVRVSVLLDRRTAAPDFPARVALARAGTPRERRHAFSRLAAKADATVVVAPEIDGALLADARAVLAAGGRLLGGSLEAIQLAADKLELARHLEARGIAAVPARRAVPGAGCDEPVVVKPRFGAGSIGVRLLSPGAPIPGSEHELVVTPWIEGLAASVLCIAGPESILPLAPARQVLSSDGTFRYLGAGFPVTNAPGGDLALRAVSLATRAVSTLPAPRGFYGVDLILSHKGRDSDRVVEINPRLMTSYCALRRRTPANLAHHLLEVAAGRPVEAPAWCETPLEFRLDGCGDLTAARSESGACGVESG